MDFWLTIFGKKADTLRTNNNGIYVLIDNHFRLIMKMTDSKQYIEHTPEVCLSFTAFILWKLF